MKLNIVQAASLIMLFTLIAVPSLAFTGSTDSSCYQAPLLYEGAEYGKVKLIPSNEDNKLEVEIEEFLYPGLYSVQIFKDYYSDIVLGDIEINGDGDGKEEFVVIFSSPDFTVHIVNGGYVLTSGEWTECEKPIKPENIKISPSALNLKSSGKWVTVKIIYPFEEVEPTEFEMHIGDQTLTPEIKKVEPDHILLKFKREEIQQNCKEEVETVGISFRIGDEVVELTDTIKIINYESYQVQQTRSNEIKTRSNNGKAKGKDKN